MRVAVRNNNITSALRILKRSTKEDLAELKEKQHYTKPSAKRNKAKQAARIREQKRQRNENKNRI
jgi:ribosomal protein S21